MSPTMPLRNSPHSDGGKAKVVIYPCLSDQHLTNKIFNGSNITSVFIHVAYYNNNWIISL